MLMVTRWLVAKLKAARGYIVAAGQSLKCNVKQLVNQLLTCPIQNYLDLRICVSVLVYVIAFKRLSIFVFKGNNVLTDESN